MTSDDMTPEAIVRLHPGFLDDERIEGLSHEARYAYLVSLNLAASDWTSGIIPRLFLAPCFRDVLAERWITAELIAADLWGDYSKLSIEVIELPGLATFRAGEPIVVEWREGQA